MKKVYLITCFACLLLSTITWGQEQISSFTSAGKITYEMYLNFDGLQLYEATLLFNNDIALFKYRHKINRPSASDNYENDFFVSGYKMSVFDTMTYTVLSNKQHQYLYALKGGIDANHNYYYTKEPIPKLDWVLSNEKKKINSIECFLAKATFRGRVYHAWYAPAIPSTFGPWKLNGLPGLIVEAYDTYKEVGFQLKSIDIPYQVKQTTLNDEYPIMDIREAIKKQQGDFSDLESKLRSKLDRGIKVEVAVKITNAIELNYDDLTNQ